MITSLALLYLLFGIVYFYTHKSGYSLLRFILKEKNINIYLAVEIIFLIFTSYIVFTTQPLNWIIAMLMFLHAFGIVWVIVNPKNFYALVKESIKLDSVLMENTVVLTFIGYAVLTMFSKVLYW
jgi:hypothetical protein